MEMIRHIGVVGRPPVSQEHRFVLPRHPVAGMRILATRGCQGDAKQLII